MVSRTPTKKHVPSSDQVRVVIVDDSRTQRALLRTIIDLDPRLIVVGEAESAQHAREVIKAENPDVLTLDIEMPEMDGLVFLDHLMRLRPMPVVMISGTASPNSAKGVRALALGAVDCLSKPSIDPSSSPEMMCDRIVSAAMCVAVRAPKSTCLTNTPSTQTQPVRSLVLLGASTGGVVTLEQILTSLRPPMPPIFIAQHMPAPFLFSLASRLDRALDFSVRVADVSSVLEPNSVTFAPGGNSRARLAQIETEWSVKVDRHPAPKLYSPSIDEVFFSAAEWSQHVVAVILTGLGSDGAEGLSVLGSAGARTLVQSPDSAVAPGMPRSAKSRYPAAREFALDHMAHAIFEDVHAVRGMLRK